MAQLSSILPLIVEMGLSSERGLDEIQARQVIYGGGVELNLLELGQISENTLLDVLAQATTINRAPVGPLSVDSELTSKLEASLQSRGHSLPDASPSECIVSRDTRDNTCIYFAHGQKPDLALAEEILECHCELYVTSELRIQEALARVAQQPLSPRLQRVLRKLKRQNVLSETTETTAHGQLGQPQPISQPRETSTQPIGKPRQPIGKPRQPTEETSTLPGNVHLKETAPAPRVNLLHHSISPLEPMSSESTQLEETASLGETAPPPEGYEAIAARTDVGKRRPIKGSASPRHTYSSAEATQDLLGAKSRERVVDILIHFAAQYFDYAGIFAVIGSEARGLKSSGDGAATSKIKELKIPLDLPSAFRDVRESSRHRTARLRTSGLEGAIARDLLRPTSKTILLLPISVRKRSVLLLWGDRGDLDVNEDELDELLKLAPLVANALERILIEKVRTTRLPSIVQRPPKQDSSPKEQGSATATSPPRARPLPTEPGPVSRFASDLGSASEASFQPALAPEAPVIPHLPQPIRRETQRNFAAPAAQPPTPLQSIEPFVPPEGPPLISRRIVPLDRSPAAPPAPRLNPSPVPRLARAADKSPGTLISRRPPLQDHQDAELVPPPPELPSPLSYPALVQALLAGDEMAEQLLAEGGETAVGALISEFPGPVQEPQSNQTPASACGPLLQALVRLGNKSIPFLTVRTADEVPSVRRWATFVLGELPGKEAARAIAGRLLDDAPEVRRAALASARRVRSDVLTRRTLRSQIEALCRDNQLSIEARCSAVEAIADIREHEAIPTLLQLLEEGDRSLLRATRWALSVLTRQDFGGDTAGWKNFWQEHRDEDRVEWLIQSLAHESRDLRRAAGDELATLAGDNFGYTQDLPESARRTAQADFRDWWENRGKAASRN